MRFLEEKNIKKTRKEWICEKCSKVLPKGSSLLQEKYVHQGGISVHRYCLNKRCNPPNDVGHRIKVVLGIIVITIMIWGLNQ